MKMRMDFQSKVNCMPNSLTLQLEPQKKRSKSSINILKSTCQQSNIKEPIYEKPAVQNDDGQSDLKFQIYDPRSKSTTTKGRRKMFRDQNFKLFERSMNLKEPESEDHLNFIK